MKHNTTLSQHYIYIYMKKERRNEDRQTGGKEERKKENERDTELM